MEKSTAGATEISSALKQVSQVAEGETGAENNSINGSKYKLKGYKKTAVSFREDDEARNNSENCVNSEDTDKGSKDDTNSQIREEMLPRHDKPSGPLYCHFFPNFGKCSYEERTGNICKYEHRIDAPMCDKGSSCTRNKCMYRHPDLKESRSSNFLGQKWTISPQPSNTQGMNPWQSHSTVVNSNQQQQGQQAPWIGIQNPWQGNQNLWQGNQNLWQGNQNLWQGTLNQWHGAQNPWQGAQILWQGAQNPWPVYGPYRRN